MDRISTNDALGGRLLFNVLVKDADNAREVWEASEGFAVMGIVLKQYPSLDEACDAASAIKEISGLVSIGLGGGDPSQWQRVVEVALRVDPGHINQVFSATGYTVGALQARGFAGNVVNALVAPGGKPGYVIISTGPLSEAAAEKAVVHCDAALRMTKEVGGASIKVFPLQGDKKLEELRAIAKAAREVGIPIIEPTGGITPENAAILVNACLDGGPDLIIPHVHTSIMEKPTGRTQPARVAELVKIGKRCLGI